MSHVQSTYGLFSCRRDGARRARGPLQDVDTVNPPLPAVSLPLRRLDQADGWTKQRDGEWVKADRKIESEFSAGAREGSASLGLSEFRSMERRTVDSGGRKFYVRVITRTYGAYVSPFIQRDWFTMPRATVLVFENFPFLKADSYKFGSSLRVEAESIRWTEYDGISRNREHPGPIEEQEIREIIGKNVKRAAKPDFRHKFRLVVLPVEQGRAKRVRFLFEAFNIKDRSSGLEKTQRELLPSHFLQVTPKTLQHQYFESDFAAFRDFFAPLS